jgi:PBSX family phage terminase large subunit
LFELSKAPQEGEDREYAVITRTYDSFKRNILPLIVTLVGGDVRHYYGKREMVLWGKKIHIIGADDDRAESKIRGASFAGAYVDEVSIVPEAVFRMLISRCVMGGGIIFCTTNPDSPFHWLKKDFLTDNPDVKSWRFVLDDNPTLLKEEKEYLARQYRGLWYQRYILGLWVQAQGAIYDFFDPKIHVIDFPPGQAQEYLVGVDYGTTNPCSFVLLGFNRSKYPNMWIEQIYYYDSKIAQRQKTDSEYAADFMRFTEGKAIRAVYIDPSAASFKLELQRQGVQALYDAENEVIDGIRAVSNLMMNGTLKICSCCTAMISEFQSYVWDPKCAKLGEDKPLKANDHSLDALRYIIESHFLGKDQSRLSPQDLERNLAESRGLHHLPSPFQDPQF